MARPDLRRATGRAAEEAAALHLEQRGYVIAARNWRCRTGELDLIATDGDVLVIVEVRSRRSSSARFGTAIEAINPRKCAQVRSTALVYLSHTRRESAKVRFDVIAITFALEGGIEELKHIEGAF
ncbi:YraN family protein [Cohnella sp. AR92]|nr:YraN family protein [Cohnella sp. AR92]